MGGVVGAAFGATLERHRERFNAQFAATRRATRGLEPEAFKEYLRVCVDPVVEAASSSGAGDGMNELVSVLYELALELVAAELAGPGGRYPVISHMWRELFSAVPLLLVGRPRDVVAALSNAVVQLSSESGVSAQAWLDRMLDVATDCTTADELLAVGQVVAWQCGMAHFRDSALRVGANLRVELAASVGFDVTESRWPRGDGEALRVVARLGDFLGLGGAFDSPPEVLQSGGRLFVFDNQACWTIHADRYGATLKRFGRSLPEEKVLPSLYDVNSEGRVALESLEAFEAPFRASSIAANDEMAVVTSRNSHRVRIVAAAMP